MHVNMALSADVIVERMPSWNVGLNRVVTECGLRGLCKYQIPGLCEREMGQNCLSKQTVELVDWERGVTARGIRRLCECKIEARCESTWNSWTM